MKMSFGGERARRIGRMKHVSYIRLCRGEGRRGGPKIVGFLDYWIISLARSQL